MEASRYRPAGFYKATLMCCSAAHVACVFTHAKGLLGPPFLGVWDDTYVDA